MKFTGRRVAWLSYLFWVQKFVGSNPAAPILNFMKVMFYKKSQIKLLKDFKSVLPCYGVAEDRFFEILKTNHGKEISFHGGHKYDLKILDTRNLNQKMEARIFKVKNFETPYKKVLGEFESYRKIQIKDELIKILQQGFELRNFFKARVLNNTKKGFSIGVCGIVGFLPYNNSMKIKKDKTLIVYLESFNFNQGVVNFSQKNVHKKTNKVLLKLSSRIMFIYNSNVRS